MYLIDLLYTLREKNIFLWKNNDDISFIYDITDSFPDALKNQIKQKKDEILEILDYNTLYSKEDSKRLNFFKIPDLYLRYELSNIQKGIYLQDSIDTEKTAYNIPLFIRIKKVNLLFLKKAIRYVLEKNPILRVIANQNFKFKIENTDEYSINEIQINSDQLKSLCESKAKTTFKLDQGKLINIDIISITGKEDVVLNLTHHHLIADAYSIHLILNKIFSYYSHLLNDTLLSNNQHSYNKEFNYFDYIEYQNYLLRTTKYKKAILRLSNKLDNSEVLHLQKHTITAFDNHGSTFNFELQANVYENLRKIAYENNVSTYSLLLTCLYHVLSVYSTGQTNFPICITVSNRPFELKDMIGPCISTIPLIPEYNPRKNLIHNIKKFNEEIIYLNQYNQINLNILTDKLNQKTKNIIDLTQVMFTMHNFKYKELFRDEFEYIEFKEEVAQFGISITATEKNNNIFFDVCYATNLYEHSYVKGIFDSYIYLLSHLDERVLLSNISKINMLDSTEYNKIIYEWNSLKQDYPRDKTISELFEEQVKKTPDSIAVIDDEGKISYSELNRRSNQLAAYIRKSGVVAGKLVGIGIDRSIDMIISILSVLKAGGGYIPIDPSHPKERFKYMLDISDSHILLTHSKFHKKVVGCARTIIEIDKIEGLDKYEVDNLGKLSTSKDISVVIFTSGTTGKPKGVMIEHRQKLHHIHLLIDQLGLSTKDKIAQTASQGFDISVWQMLAPLLVGGSTNIFSTSLIKDSEKFLKKIINQSITIVQLIPVYLDALLDIAALNPQYVSFNSLRYIIITGESASQDTCGKCFKIFNKPILNLYGPAECADDVTVYCMHDASDIRRKIPIGYPMANIQLYILNEVMQPVPIGCIGELYIGGECVSRGYINRPDLTAEKFVADIFTKEEKNRKCIGNRLYKTGDLARYFSNGNIEFLGRADSQVKIRGYRIELGEIETSIREYENISDCVAVAQEVELGDKRLIAYLIPKDKELFNKKALCKSSSDEEFYILSGNDNLKEEVKESLLKRLPEYMVPSYFVFLNKKPVTRNGKIDYKSLPSIESLIGKNESYLAPRNELEKEICVIWSEILGIAEEKIGINDNFFKLGGNSILAIKLVTKLNKHFKAHISAATLFKNNLPSSLSSYLQANSHNKILIPKFDIVPYGYKLSFAQERLWFIENYEGGTNAYNVPMFFKVNEEANVNALKKSIISIINKHDILRTVIVEDENGDTYQSVIELDKFETPWKVVDNKKQLDSELDKDANHIFNLRNQFPIKVCFYEVKKEKNYYLSIVIHHISFDGWSTDIFFKELAEYYSYYSQITEDTQLDDKLPKLSIQYRDFALWQRSYMSGEVLDRQLKYWQKELEDYTPLNLVLDNPRPPLIDYTGKDINFQLEENISADLRILAKELGVSLYSVLLSAFCITLRCYSNQDDIVIGTTTANRNYVGIEDLIGLFVNTLVFRSKIDSNDLVIDYIKQVSAKVIDNQFYQDLPFEKLVEKLEVTKDTNKHPIFQVMFGIQDFDNNLFWYSESGSNFLKVLKEYKTDLSLYNVAKFDFSIFMDTSLSIIRGRFNYATSIFEDNTISGYVDTYKLILNQFASIVKNTQYLKKIKLSEINYLNEIEYNKIIYEWNSLKQDYPRDKTISELFEEQVKKTPDSIAVIDDEGKISYSELNRRSNQLAAYIRKSGVVAGDKVGIYLERSDCIPLAVISILKIGAVFVPIGTEISDKRIITIIEDSNIKLIITKRILENKLLFLNTNYNFLLIDNPKNQENDEFKKLISIEREFSNARNDLAYIMYTSGTTGSPKGVMVKHSSVINYIFAIKQKLSLDMRDKHLMIAEHIFDLGYTSFFGSLLTGGELHFINFEIMSSIKRLTDYIIINKITFIKSTPVYLKLILSDVYIEIFNTLAKVIVGGEVLQSDILDFFKKELNKIDIEFYNHYGPTETTIGCTMYRINYKDPKVIKNFFKYSIIGKPLANLSCYILSKDLKQLPIGAVGELYIGGAGLSEGYLNKPELNSLSFVKYPLILKDKKIKYIKLYKSGDIVRWTSDGNIMFLGRNDSQIKLRGYRIELGEIEAVLKKNEDISNAVVLVKENDSSEKKIVAYIVPAEFEISDEEIRSYLKPRLPVYMIPDVFIFLDKIPLTKNGKIDKKILLEVNLYDKTTYYPPKSDLQKHICKIWNKILNLEEECISIRDNFFTLGGNSILAIKLIGKLNKEFNLNLSVFNIFQHNTIEKFALFLQSHINDKKLNYDEKWEF
ncbi:MAG: amino acid adenylation domain-containing protein [Arcobacter sp.]|nr:amino acid adenylation domain-containing protein [Arcobacter sp.]